MTSEHVIEDLMPSTSFFRRVPSRPPDVGCNLGFFTFNMANRGGFSVGIDYGYEIPPKPFL